ncbi:hypothetical protein CEXT_207061 [Caerostris extrusa]|uniref:Uncharacterized protein n=1 Tax=Caerostris extrusa TaxID=172846 RepID=A0AAV4XY16_CAEEX|nr:hypothetical protein CEXT_207061 [Caerostris extrusa]
MDLSFDPNPYGWPLQVFSKHMNFSSFGHDDVDKGFNQRAHDVDIRFFIEFLVCIRLIYQRISSSLLCTGICLPAVSNDEPLDSSPSAAPRRLVKERKV